ncbi:DNA-binding protein [Pseudomonas sp. NY15463]|uniref:DNA-binding protein n=1 Tax=Pseudomonas sp. NY15463 TaxID=3400361 RepID=UPI003A8C3A91
MSRVGVTKEAVEQARDTLLARGENPSIDAVRIELGNTGSKSTIHRYLKALEQPVKLGDAAGLSAPLGRLVEQLSAQLQREAQACVEVAQTAFEQQQAQLQGQLALAQRALAAAHQQHEVQLSALQLRLADKEQQLQLAEQRHEQELGRQQTQLRQLQGQLQTVQQGALARQAELTQLHRDNGRLQAEQRQTQEALARLEAQLEQRDAQVQGLRAMLAQAQGVGEELRRQCAERDQALAQLRLP